MFSPAFLTRFMMALIAISVMFTFWNTIVVRNFVVVDDIEYESSPEETEL